MIIIFLLTFLSLGPLQERKVNKKNVIIKKTSKNNIKKNKKNEKKGTIDKPIKQKEKIATIIPIPKIRLNKNDDKIKFLALGTIPSIYLVNYMLPEQDTTKGNSKFIKNLTEISNTNSNMNLSTDISHSTNNDTINLTFHEDTVNSQQSFFSDINHDDFRTPKNKIKRIEDGEDFDQLLRYHYSEEDFCKQPLADTSLTYDSESMEIIPFKLFDNLAERDETKSLFLRKNSSDLDLQLHEIDVQPVANIPVTETTFLKTKKPLLEQGNSPFPPSSLATSHKKNKLLKRLDTSSYDSNKKKSDRQYDIDSNELYEIQSNLQDSKEDIFYNRNQNMNNNDEDNNSIKEQVYKIEEQNKETKHEQQIQTLQTQLKEINNKYQTLLQVYYNEIQNYKELLQSYQEQNNNISTNMQDVSMLRLIEENCQLKQELNQKEDLIQNIKAFQTDNIALKNQINELTQEKNEEYNIWENKVKELQETLQKQIELNKSFYNNQSKYDESLSSITHTIYTENDILTTQLLDLKLQLEKEKNTNDHLIVKVQNLEKENHELLSICQEYQTSNHELIEKLQDTDETY